MMFSERKDITVSVSENNKLEKMIIDFSDENSPSIIEAFNEGIITEEELSTLFKILDINGYTKQQIYDMPFAYALRITG